MMPSWFRGVMLLCVGLFAVGMWQAPFFEPNIRITQIVPFFLVSLAVTLGGLGGDQLGALRLPEGHTLFKSMATLGALASTASIVALLKLAPAGAYGTIDHVVWLESACETPTQRAPLEMLPRLRVLDRDLPQQSQALQARLKPRFEAALVGCIPSLRTAFEDPEGTHRSWQLVRDWWVTHPQWAPLPSDLATATPEERRHRPVRRPVSIDL